MEKIKKIVWLQYDTFLQALLILSSLYIFKSVWSLQTWNFSLFHYDGNASTVIEEAILLLICMLSSFSFLRVEYRFHWYTDPHRQIP